jgi:hypothetical protein
LSPHADRFRSNDPRAVTMNTVRRIGRDIAPPAR